ncbi:MAG: hypothetical protein C0471_19350 [Erythrobacter sp.]|nr:hypothetical protein [Erythrobacter sp.]
MNKKQLPTFTPVPRQRMRRGGWSAERQQEFIALLAETGSVRAACRRMGVGENHIYKLRGHPEAESFRKAWEAALDLGIARIEDVAMDRALYGVETPVYHRGELIGTRRVHNDRLLMFMLKNRAPRRFPEGQQRRPDAIDAMQIERLKKQWRKEWENERNDVSADDVRASIDKKIEELRRRVEGEQAAAWARLSDETREAWARFVELRERDWAAAGADADVRAQTAITPHTKEWPPIPKPPPGWRQKPPPPPPKTRWSLTDDNFDP